MVSRRTKAKILLLISEGYDEVKQIWRLSGLTYNYLLQALKELQMSGFIEKKGKGLYRITEKGKKMLDVLDFF